MHLCRLCSMPPAQMSTVALCPFSQIYSFWLFLLLHYSHPTNGPEVLWILPPLSLKPPPPLLCWYLLSDYLLGSSNVTSMRLPSLATLLNWNPSPTILHPFPFFLLSPFRSSPCNTLCISLSKNCLLVSLARIECKLQKSRDTSLVHCCIPRT